nr:MAG TPA: hypothetical protein [Caudoviricetes sp.]
MISPGYFSEAAPIKATPPQPKRAKIFLRVLSIGLVPLYTIKKRGQL